MEKSVRNNFHPKNQIHSQAPSFIFDIGNVLISCDFNYGAELIARHSPLSPQEILSRFEESKLTDTFDLGAITKEEFARQVRRTCLWENTVEELENIWNSMLKPELEMLELLEELQQQAYPTYLLSNINPFHLPYVKECFPILSRTTGQTYSCEINLIKPSRAIFEHIATTFELDPSRSLFIDDREENVEAAKQVGFRAIRHQRISTTRMEIEQFILDCTS